MKPYAEPYIALADCKHGFTYKIVSRNLDIGVFNKDENGFVGIREKFGSEYLFTEYHWDTGAPYGTVCPIEIIEECPIKNLNESLGTFCSTCGVKVQFEKTTKWIHDDPVECSKLVAVWKDNKELFDYLDALRKKPDET